MKRSLAWLAPLALVTLASTASAGERPPLDAYWLAAPLARTAARTVTPSAFVASVDERRQVPTFVWAARRPPMTATGTAHRSPEQAARQYIAEHASLYGLSTEALDTAVIEHVHDTGRGGIVVTLRQRPGGIEVFHSDAKVLMTRDLDLIAIGGALHDAATRHPKAGPFRLGPEEALIAAVMDLRGVALSPNDVASRRTEGGYTAFELSAGAAAATSGLRFIQPARDKRVYFPLPDRLVAGYYVEAFVGDVRSRDSESYAYVIAADDGRILYRQNLTHHDAFQYRVWADATGDYRPKDGPLVDFTPHPTGSPDGIYPDFAAPAFVSMDGFNKNPSGQSDPWLPSGATETRGNNVDCYTDDDAPDGFSANDIRASVTSANTFDRVYDVSLGPQANSNQKMAALTDLFYVTNWMHDWWYDSGFDEAAGDAQKDNLGRGGLGNDALHAEGQDGAPQQRDNSDMMVPADGASPRMQMYVWDGASAASVSVSPLNQTFGVGLAAFGPQTFDVSGAVVLASDGSGTTTDACEPIVNSVAGMVALVDRGTCTFKQKAINAQNAGAIGMILADNQPNEAPPPMGDGSPAGTVSIAVASISQSDGATLKAALQSGPETATLTRSSAVDHDGTIDNTVIAHEWGHYLHLRQVACGLPICDAESEGWADFNALLMVLREGDNLQGAYPMAQYATVSFPNAGYFGIRRYPYSIDKTKDPLTFKYITSGQALPAGVPSADMGIDNAEAHNAGEIWAMMLFEAYVALAEQTTQATPPYAFADARRRMSDYVEAGMQLAPANPTYTEQRDSILASALAADPNDFLVLAQGFAKRGAGTCAVSPPRDSDTFDGVVESFDVKPNAAIVTATLDDSVLSCDSDGFLDAEETGNVRVELLNNGTTTLTGAKVTVASKAMGISFPNGNDVTVAAIPPFQKAVASVQVALDPNVMAKEAVELDVSVAAVDGCTATPTLITAPHANVDEVPASSTTDDVEATTSAWTPKGDASDLVWSITETKPGDHAWRGIDFGSPSDTALVSPSVDVGTTDDFVITASHRYQFETSMGVYWDGGVIEVSTDGGKTWKDVTQIASGVDAGYGGTIGDPQDGGAQNVLRNRQGFVDHNASWPSRDTLTVNLGKALAGKSAMVRFRIGSDDAAGEFGWELDDLGFAGITNTPFSALVQDKGTCGNIPKADAGPDQSVYGGDTVTLDGSNSSDPKNKALTFAWTESQGLEVGLSGTKAAKTTFVAPVVDAPTSLAFQLSVSNGTATASDTVVIVVNPGSAARASDVVPGGGCGCRLERAEPSGGAAAAIAALAALLAARRRRRGPRAK